MKILKFLRELIPKNITTLSVDTVLEINNITKHYNKVKDMLELWSKEDAAENVNSIDPTSNIVLSIPDSSISISRTIDGNLSFKLSEDLNLSGHRVLTNGFIVYKILSKIKISVPAGIQLSFKCPINSPYINKIYPVATVLQKGEDKQLPDNIIYTDLYFVIYFDSDQVKVYNKTFTLKKGSELVDLVFSPIYFPGNPHFPNIEKTIIVSSSEVYSTFESIF